MMMMMAALTPLLDTLILAGGLRTVAPAPAPAPPPVLGRMPFILL